MEFVLGAAVFMMGVVVGAGIAMAGVNKNKEENKPIPFIRGKSEN